MDAIALIGALLLVLLNGFFVATEFAIVKVRPTRIEELVRKHRPGAAVVRRLVSQIDRYLSATQLGITLASLGLGWIGEPAVARLIEPVLASANIQDPRWVHNISLAVAFAALTFLHIVVGELAPKSLAIQRAEAVALAVAYPMRVFYILFAPAVWLLTRVATWVIRPVGITSGAPGEQHSEEEIKIILSQARSAGLLTAARAELLRKAMSLSTKIARHLMVPRNEAVFLDVNLPLSDNLARAMDSGHTRFPLCDRELDEVLGIVDIRDVLYHAMDKRNVDLRKLAEPAVYFPEMMTGERLLVEFRARRVTMAVIVDEYGGASGIITAADVVAAVMGEIQEDAELELVALPGGAYDVDGLAPLDEVEQALKIAIHANTMRTVAGFLMARLGRMPRVGDRVLEQGFVFAAMDVDGPRVRRVRIQAEPAEGRQQRSQRKPAKNDG